MTQGPIFNRSPVIVTATGNGTTVDTGIQSAINQALELDSSGGNPQRGGIVQITRGKYLLNPITFPSGVTENLVLRGEPGTILLPNQAGKIFDLGSRSNITFENLMFDLEGQQNSSTYAIYGDGNDSLRIERCRFTKCVFGVHLRNQKRLLFAENEIDGVATLGWGFFLGGCDGAWILRNRAHDSPNGLDGLKFGPPATVGAGSVTVAASGTTVNGSGTSFQSPAVNPGDILLIGTIHARINIVNSTTQLTIEPWPGTQQTGQAYAIVKQADMKDLFVLSNECFNNGQDGINLDGSAFHNVIVANNALRENRGYGLTCKLVYDGTEMRRVIVTGNVVTRNRNGGMSFQMNDRSAEPLTSRGTVSVASGTPVKVEGSGTSFMDDVMVARRILIGTDPTFSTVAAVESDAVFYLTASHAAVSGAVLSIYPEARGLFITNNLIEEMKNSAGGAGAIGMRLQSIVQSVVAGNKLLGVTLSASVC